MKKNTATKVKKPMSLKKKIILSLVGIAVVAVLAYLLYYFLHFMNYNKYRTFLSSYEYEQGTAYTKLNDTKADVKGMDLVAENDFLKMYTDTKTATVAIYDKRTGLTTYSNPINADEDQVANKANINFLKSQLIIQYYNADIKSGIYNSFVDSVNKGQFTVESIENGVRYIYTIGDTAAIYFEIPMEYRLAEDSLKVSVPAKGIKEFGGSLYRIQMLRYLGAGHTSEEGCLVVPNGSGSIIKFNNGKKGAAAYSQYIYDIDPLVATYTTIENVNAAKLPIFGICRENSGILGEVTDGASTALLTANTSGSFNEYNYVYPTFVLRNVDNLRMFGNSSQDVYVLEPNLYDINCETTYYFLTEENKGYAGLANYYRNKLIADGVLAPNGAAGDIPFYYDVISGVKENSHFLGVQYLHTFAMTTFEEAAELSNELKAAGINNQVMNLQGWMNGGYYHNAVHNLKIPFKLGGKSGLEDLNEAVKANGGKLYADVVFQQITHADQGFNYNAEGSRYYGAGMVATFGKINPTTLRNTSNLGYAEIRYDLLSPKYLPRYVEKFAKNVSKVDIDGISLRDLGYAVQSDKKRTNIINREEALDVVEAQLQVLENTEKNILVNDASAYSFAYADDIINVAIEHNKYPIVDESIPLYEMILHGCVDYSSKLLNYQNDEDKTGIILKMIEAGAAPHYVFTKEESSQMKDTGLNYYYATTFDVWSREAVDIYNSVNAALSKVSGSQMIGHEIFDNGVRKVTYDNGVVIYINYDDEAQKAEGTEIPAMSYRMEGNN